MSLDPKLRAFLAVAETHNISHAAGRIGMTQSALSKLLRRLESDYGVRLLVRHRRGISLTADGETLMRHTQAAAIEFAHAHEEIAARKRARKIDLRIHCGLVYALDWIHAPLREMAGRHAGVDFTIDATAYENTVHRLLTGEYDAIFGYVGDAAKDPRLRFSRIHEVRTRIYARGDHPLAGTATDVAALGAASWCEYADVFRTNERLETYIRVATGRAPRVRFRTSSLSTAFELVRGSDSLLCLPSPLTQYARDQGLMPIAGDHPIWTYESGCLVRKSSANVALVSELLDRVLRKARQAVAADAE